MEFTFDFKHGCLNLFHCSFHVHFSHLNRVRTFACVFLHIFSKKYAAFQHRNIFDKSFRAMIIHSNFQSASIQSSSIFFVYFSLVHFVSTNIQYLNGVCVCIVSKIEKSYIGCHTQLSKRRKCVSICFSCLNEWHRMCVCFCV